MNIKTKLKENAMAWLNEAESDKNRIVDELTKLEFTKNEFGDDGLFNLIESFVQEFEDLYSEGGLIPMDSPNKNIENFLISKGLEIY